MTEPIVITELSDRRLSQIAEDMIRAHPAVQPVTMTLRGPMAFADIQATLSVTVTNRGWAQTTGWSDWTWIFALTKPDGDGTLEVQAKIGSIVNPNKPAFEEFMVPFTSLMRSAWSYADRLDVATVHNQLLRKLSAYLDPLDPDMSPPLDPQVTYWSVKDSRAKIKSLELRWKGTPQGKIEAAIRARQKQKRHAKNAPSRQR